MEVLYLLIPLSLVLVGAVAGALWWAVRSGQFDDLEAPAWRILFDDDSPPAPPSAEDGESPPDPTRPAD